MNISISIMSHATRVSYSLKLLQRLERMGFSAAELTVDVQDNEWENGVKALTQHPSYSDWHIVIQDDAIITKEFYRQVCDALSSVPEKNLISFYLGQVRPRKHKVEAAFKQALAEEKSWLSHPTLLWGVCIAIPTKDISPMLHHVQYYKHLLYDNRVGQYYKDNNRQVYYTTISLADHNDDLPSLVGHDHQLSEPRVCHQFVGTNRPTYNHRVVAIL